MDARWSICQCFTTLPFCLRMYVFSGLLKIDFFLSFFSGQSAGSSGNPLPACWQPIFGAPQALPPRGLMAPDHSLAAPFVTPLLWDWPTSDLTPCVGTIWTSTYCCGILHPHTTSALYIFCMCACMCVYVFIHPSIPGLDQEPVSRLGEGGQTHLKQSQQWPRHSEQSHQM